MMRGTFVSLIAVALVWTTLKFVTQAEGKSCAMEVKKCYDDKLADKTTGHAIKKEKDKQDQALMDCIESKSCQELKEATCLKSPKYDPSVYLRDVIVKKCAAWNLVMPEKKSK